MRRFYTLACTIIGLSIGTYSCVNSDYDLNNLNTDDTTLGGQDATIEIPLVTTTLTLNDLIDNNTTRAIDYDDLTIDEILDLFDQIKVLLPSDLLDGDLIDLIRLGEYPEDSYLRDIIKTLFIELSTNDEKLGNVTDIIWDNYVEYIDPECIDISSRDNMLKDFKRILSQVDSDSIEESQEYEDLLVEIADLLSEYLLSHLDEDTDVKVDLGDLSDSDETASLSDIFLGGSEQIVKTITLLVDAKSTLNVGIEVNIKCENTDIDSTISIEPNGELNDYKINISTEDLKTLLSGKSELNISGHLTTLDPNAKVDKDSGITITTSLIIAGATVTF